VGKDIHVADLSSFGKKMLSLQFDQKTVFPARDKLPSQDKYQPDYIMEAGKNPGLGVRSIHEKGIIGKGVTVAIIDMPLKSVNHPEYAGKIITYKDFSEKPDNNIHGSGVTSLLVGEWTGTAPGAKLYYAAVPPVFDATYYANALDWIVETNKKLPDGEKIRVVSISSSPTPSNEQWTNGEKYLESVKRATDAGILVLDCSENGIIGPCGYDFDNPEDVSLCKPGFLQYPDWNNKNDILVPVQYRTVAEEYDVKGYYSYLYYGDAGLSWGIPYAAGVLAMGWQVKPGLTPDEITDILFNTAYVDSNGYKYINPTAFIDQLSSME
jgi:serine protease AprX